MTSPRRREVQWQDRTAGHALHLAGADDREPSWQDYAACKDEDPGLFFPPRGGSAKAARAICARCFVRPDCLAAALEMREAGGVWGGVSFLDGVPYQPPAPPTVPPPPRPPAGQCRNGHARTEARTRTDSRGQVVCRDCQAARNHASRERKKAAA